MGGLWTVNLGGCKLLFACKYTSHSATAEVPYASYLKLLPRTSSCYKDSEVGGDIYLHVLSIAFFGGA